MKKNLRLLMMTLLCAVFNVMSAQNVTLDFTTNNWGLPEGSANKATESAQFSNESYTISLQAADGYYFNTSGYLMLGKSGSTLTLPAFNFKVGVIAVTGTSGASTAVKQNIFVGEEAVSAETTGAKEVTNQYTIASAYQAAGTVYTLKVTSAHNTQISKIEIYEVGASIKPTPEMSFDPTSVTATIGESVTLPTLTYKGDGTVTYSSSNEAVATVDASTGALTLLSAGNTTITATASETDNYKDATAHYSLTVNNAAIDDNDDYSITFANLGLENGVQYLEPLDGGAFTVTFSGGANDGKYYTTGQGIRVYGDGSFTVSAESGNLTKIVITYDGTYKPESADVVDTGSYDAETGTWTGNASSVTFTRPTGSGHWRVQVISVTTDGSTVQRKTPEIAFSAPSLEATIGEAFTEPKLSYNGDGAITYSISDQSVATINANTGKLTLVAAGTATVTATAAETANYKKGTATYSLTVNAAAENEDNTIIFSNLGLENGVQYTEPFDAGTFTVTFAGGVNDGKYYTTGQGVRVYGDGSFTIDSKAGNIVQITITYDGSNKPESAEVVNTGNYNPETGVWTGKATSVCFTRPTGSGHWRIQKIAVVFEGGEVQPTLTISGTTPFTGSTVVTITPSNEDYMVYYTTDGSNPQPGAGTTKTYSKPFTITETTTVKAVEEDYNEELSAVAEKTFTKTETATAANIAAFKNLEVNTEATLTLKNAQVVWVGTNDVYVRDESGAIDFYQTGLTFTQGQVLNGTITGKYAVYNKIPELAKTEATNAEGFKATSGTASPKTVTIAAAKSETYYCDYIKITGVKIKNEENTSNIYAYIGEDEIMLYDKFKVGMGNYNETDTYDVEGILVPYKDDYEIYITKPVSDDTSLKTCNNIAEFKALNSGTEAILKLNNAQVVYAAENGKDIFVRDASGAIEFYDLGIEFETNQILNGTITGEYSPYFNLPEIKKTDNTKAEDFTATAGSEAQPKTVSVADLCAETYLNDLVEVTGTISIEEEGDKKTIYLVSGEDKVTVYNKFKIATDDLTDGDQFTIKGIGCVYNTTWQIMPISFTKADGNVYIGDSNGDGIIDVTDVMVIVDYVLGKNPKDFIYNNANWNGDNVVDITDAMLIVYYLLGKQ